MTLLFTTPSGEILEMTPEELSFCSIYSTKKSSTEDEPCNELELPMLPTNPDTIGLDGSADAAPTPPLQNSISKSYRSLSCRSCPPLIEILTPEEILRRNSSNPPQTPGSQNKPGGRDGNKSRVFIKVAMVYDEYGQLVEESKLRYHPTTDELSLTHKLRVIKKKFHHEVSPRPNFNALKMRPIHRYSPHVSTC